MSNSNVENKFDPSLKSVFGVIAGIVLLLVISLILYIYQFSGSLSDSQQIWGYFGDFLGGVGGTLLTMLAVYLVFLTYNLQKRELTETKRALNTQNEQLRIQQFQNVFFRLLERKDHLINNLSGSNMQGIQVLSHMESKFRSKSQKNNREEALIWYWKSYKGQLISYFNSFIATIDFIRSIKITGDSQVKIDEQLKIRDQIIRIYASNLSLSEKKALKLIFEYHHNNTPNDNEINSCHDYANHWKIL